ncbi:MAG TPA: hypothetical protein VG672_10955 [Bryobacteraceae bacterium]|jgi:hypothetical protein|nr:hypothetical protein [Bryobacteraceae bacterium]
MNPAGLAPGAAWSLCLAQKSYNCVTGESLENPAAVTISASMETARMRGPIWIASTSPYRTWKNYFAG